MKPFALLIAVGLLFAQCQTEKEKTVQKPTVNLLSEQLQYYPLSEIDSVYSIAIKVHATDTVVVKYNVTITQEFETYSDSLVLDIAAGQNVTGQIIFPNCRVKNRKRPTFTSKLTTIEN